MRITSPFSCVNRQTFISSPVKVAVMTSSPRSRHQVPESLPAVALAMVDVFVGHWVRGMAELAMEEPCRVRAQELLKPNCTPLQPPIMTGPRSQTGGMTTTGMMCRGCGSGVELSHQPVELC